MITFGELHARTIVASESDRLSPLLARFDKHRLDSKNQVEEVFNFLYQDDENPKLLLELIRCPETRQTLSETNILQNPFIKAVHEGNLALRTFMQDAPNLDHYSFALRTELSLIQLCLGLEILEQWIIERPLKYRLKALHWAVGNKKTSLVRNIIEGIPSAESEIGADEHNLIREILIKAILVGDMHQMEVLLSKSSMLSRIALAYKDIVNEELLSLDCVHYALDRLVASPQLDLMQTPNTTTLMRIESLNLVSVTILRECLWAKLGTESGFDSLDSLHALDAFIHCYLRTHPDWIAFKLSFEARLQLQSAMLTHIHQIEAYAGYDSVPDLCQELIRSYHPVDKHLARMLSPEFASIHALASRCVKREVLLFRDYRTITGDTVAQNQIPTVQALQNVL